MNKPTVTQVPAHTNNYSKNIYPKTGIVLHWIVGSLASADKTFQDPGRIASVQYGIGKNGEIHQYVEDKFTAYHAGVSKYNQNYFGIEHEGGHLYNGERVKPSQACHESSVKLVAWLCKMYNIPCDRKHIIKHSETGYATQCCGTLDIDYIVSEANKLLNSNPMAQWCIEKAIRDAAATNMDTFLNKYRKDVKDAGVDPVEWWVRNGSAEVPVMYEKLIVDRNKYKAQAEGLQPTIDSLNSIIRALNIDLEGVNEALKKASHDLLVANNALDNVEPTITELKGEVAHWKSLASTNEKLYKDTNILLNRCREGKKGISITELIQKVILFFRNKK